VTHHVNSTDGQNNGYVQVAQGITYVAWFGLEPVWIGSNIADFGSISLKTGLIDRNT